MKMVEKVDIVIVSHLAMTAHLCVVVVQAGPACFFAKDLEYFQKICPFGGGQGEEARARKCQR